MCVCVCECVCARARTRVLFMLVVHVCYHIKLRNGAMEHCRGNSAASGSDLLVTACGLSQTVGFPVATSPLPLPQTLPSHWLYSLITHVYLS